MNKAIFIVCVLFSGAMMQDCNTENWQQYSPNLNNCYLENANIAWTNLENASFIGANLINANLTGSNFSFSNFTNANLSGADLTWAVFDEAVLIEANLSETGLGATSFINADLTGADLTGATLFNTDFSEACLEGVVGLSFDSNGYIGEPFFADCAETPNNFPNWEDSPEQYEYTAYINSIVYYDGEQLGEEGDLFAAFDEEGNVRGLGVALLVPFGPYENSILWEIILRSNEEAGDILSFRYYDASQNTILYILETHTFVAEALLGSLIDPLEFTAVFSDEENEEENEENIFEDLNQDGYDDVSFAAGQASADSNNDGLVDSFPVISIVDEEIQVLIEGELEQYVDSGATCLDQEDGNIFHAIEVSGDIVNINNAGTYVLFYNCSDSEGNEAQTKKRIIFVIEDSVFIDNNEDGFDDESYAAGAFGGDVNLDSVVNVADIVTIVNLILNGER